MAPSPRLTIQVLTVLNVMLEEPTGDWYGLDLANRASLKTGTIYPILARLETAGWLSSAREAIDPAEAGRPRRRLYRLTGEGERAARSALRESRMRLGASGEPPLRATLRPQGRMA